MFIFGNSKKNECIDPKTEEFDKMLASENTVKLSVSSERLDSLLRKNYDEEED